MQQKRCPLCYVKLDSGVIVHLQRDHRRTDAEARELLQRSVESTLGWDPEIKKKKACFPANPLGKPKLQSL